MKEGGSMERLTKYSNDIIRNKAVNILRKLDSGNGLNGDELALVSSFCLIERVENKQLKEYENLEEQGLLLRLLCRVGDTVYTNVRVVGWYMREKNKPYKAEIAFIGINGKDNFVNVVFENGNMLQFKFSDFGKTIFLTMEEAEKKLRNRMCEEMQWLTWKNVKEWGKIQCPMLGDKCVMTYYREDEPCYYSYTAPFVQDGEIYYYRFNHDEGCWDESTYCIGEYREGDWG